MSFLQGQGQGTSVQRAEGRQASVCGEREGETDEKFGEEQATGNWRVSGRKSWREDCRERRGVFSS